MSDISFRDDPVFWVAFVILNCYWLAMFVEPVRGRMLTAAQVRAHEQSKSMGWFEHFGFWYLLVLQPVLAYGVAKMWPLWQTRGDAIAFCLLAGGVAGYILQTGWSRGTGPIDTWSRNGLPNAAGIKHILYMHLGTGIMLMLLLSGVWWQEMTVSMFFGFSAFVVNHLLLAKHWPARAFFSDKRLKELDMQRIGKAQAAFLSLLSIALLGGGFYLLAV